MTLLSDYKVLTNINIVYALKHVFGIGPALAHLIMIRLGYTDYVNTIYPSIDHLNKGNKLELKLNCKRKRWTNDLIIESIFKEIKENVCFDMKLKDKIFININTLKSINSYKGIRHMYLLPVNGQRTHTNARTQKMKKITQTRSSLKKKK